MTFATLLRTVRHARNLDQAELGALIGVSHATISQWENGHRWPDIRQIVALCKHLRISADMLLGLVPLVIET